MPTNKYMCTDRIFLNSVLTEMGSCSAYCSPICFLECNSIMLHFMLSQHIQGAAFFSPRLLEFTVPRMSLFKCLWEGLSGFVDKTPGRAVGGCFTPGWGLPHGTRMPRSVSQFGVCLSWTHTHTCTSVAFPLHILSSPSQPSLTLCISQGSLPPHCWSCQHPFSLGLGE